MAEAAPSPVLRAFTEPALDRILVYVVELLDKALIIAHVVIVITLLLKGRNWRSQARDGNLQRLNRFRQHLHIRLRHQKVDVFRHHNISVYAEAVVSPGTLERREKYVA